MKVAKDFQGSIYLSAALGRLIRKEKIQLKSGESKGLRALNLHPGVYTW